MLIHQMKKLKIITAQAAAMFHLGLGIARHYMNLMMIRWNKIRKLRLVIQIWSKL